MDRPAARQKQYSISNLIILKCMDLEEFELFARNIGHIVIFSDAKIHSRGHFFFSLLSTFWWQHGYCQTFL